MSVERSAGYVRRFAARPKTRSREVERCRFGAVLEAGERVWTAGAPPLAHFRRFDRSDTLRFLYSASYRSEPRGTSSLPASFGKSFAFQIGALITSHIARLRGDGNPGTLRYPRVVLAQNQFQDLATSFNRWSVLGIAARAAVA